MKTYRIWIGALSLAVVVLACLLLFGRAKPAGEKPREMWYTNTVEAWHTNVVEKWRTNTIEVERPTTVTVTNEIIKEVPAKLSELERQAAIVGYKYIQAPLLTNSCDALYKTSPLAVEVHITESAKHLLTGATGTIRKRAEDVLRSRSIPVAEESPYHLSLSIATLWETDLPRVALLVYRLELRGTASLERQNDIIKSAGSLWSTSTSQLVRTGSVMQDVSKSLQEQVGKFCQDYLDAKGKEKEIESRTPAIPADFLSKRE